MDPQAAINNIINNLTGLFESIDGLSIWLSKGGFSPKLALTNVNDGEDGPTFDVEVMAVGPLARVLLNWPDGSQATGTFVFDEYHGLLLVTHEAYTMSGERFHVEGA